MKRVTPDSDKRPAPFDASTCVDRDSQSFTDLISAMETAAYALVRSGDGIAANAMFYAVAELEKLKLQDQSDSRLVPFRRQA